MNIIRLVLCTTVMALVGCASASRQPLPEARYSRLAEDWVTLNQCGRSGMMAPGMASQGIQYINNILSVHTYDQAYMTTLVNSYSRSSSPSVETCNAMAMQVAGVRRQEIQQNATAAASQQEVNSMINANRVRAPVYCNSIGTQVVCN